MRQYQNVASFSAAAALINSLDDGCFYEDFGINNSGSVLGVAYQPNATINTTAGVAEATRVYPIALV